MILHCLRLSHTTADKYVRESGAEVFEIVRPEDVARCALRAGQRKQTAPMVGRENEAAPIDPNMMLTRRVAQTQKAVSYIPLLGARYFMQHPLPTSDLKNVNSWRMISGRIEQECLV